MSSSDFGICRLAIIPVFEKPTYQALQCNQLLFGEHYEVTGAKDNWLSISTAFDKTGGWIQSPQHHSISREHFEQINTSDYKITTDISSTLLYNKNPLTIAMGSIVPISNSELFKAEEQLAFNGESKSLSQKRDVEFLKNILSKYFHSPFHPGGKSPFGIDAPGLVQMAFKICGYKLPRTAEQQVNVGTHIDNFDVATPGDIVILKRTSSHEIISAILYSAGKIILMDGYARLELIDAKGIKPIGHKKYTWEIQDIRRVIV